MSGMGSSLQLTNQTVVAAFRSALIHQGIIALLIFFLLAMLWVSVREWIPAARHRPGPAVGWPGRRARRAAAASGSASACSGWWTACCRCSRPCRSACRPM